MRRLVPHCVVVLLAGLALSACSPSVEQPPPEVPGTSSPVPSTAAGTAALPSAGRPAEPPDPALVAAARKLMGAGAREERCGPYGLLTDVADFGLLSACARLARQLDGTFEERFGVTPVGEPRETILLFARLEEYREFTRGHGRVALGYAGYALASRGLAVFYADGVLRGTFVATLTHELTHLVLRRTFGDTLPPWLAEGLADGIGDSATDTGFLPLTDGTGIRVQLERLRGAYELDRVGPLERLASLERRQFDRGVISYDYEQSTLAVRYLLTDPELGPRFRAFLADLSRGRSYSAERFRAALEMSWQELDEGLRTWTRSAAPESPGAAEGRAQIGSPKVTRLPAPLHGGTLRTPPAPLDARSPGAESSVRSPARISRNRGFHECPRTLEEP